MGYLCSQCRRDRMLLGRAMFSFLSQTSVDWRLILPVSASRSCNESAYFFLSRSHLYLRIAGSWTVFKYRISISTSANSYYTNQNKGNWPRQKYTLCTLRLPVLCTERKSHRPRPKPQHSRQLSLLLQRWPIPIWASVLIRIEALVIPCKS